jgi:hypothetical protein
MLAFYPCDNWLNGKSEKPGNGKKEVLTSLLHPDPTLIELMPLWLRVTLSPSATLRSFGVDLKAPHTHTMHWVRVAMKVTEMELYRETWLSTEFQSISSTSKAVTKSQPSSSYLEQEQVYLCFGETLNSSRKCWANTWCSVNSNCLQHSCTFSLSEPKSNESL